MKKFSKAFGEVEVISEDKNVTVIVIVATGEQKRLATPYANLSNEPFVKVVTKKVITVQRELTKEEKDHLEYISPKLDWIEERSRRDRKAGRSGGISIWK